MMTPRRYTITFGMAFALWGAITSTILLTNIAKASSPPAEHKADEPKKDGHGEEKKADAPAPAAGASKGPETKTFYLPRRIKAPSISYDNLETGKTINHNYKDWRFSLIGVLGTWNRKSTSLAKVITPKVDLLAKRKIAVVGIFSHDTKESLSEWIKVTGATFTVGLASVKFIEDMKNPKVPTFWLVNHRGETIYFSEMPTDEELSDVLSKLFLWTNF